MPHKKIIFVIVEGPSDEDAIGTLLSRFYNGNEVHIHVVHGDITTQRCVNPHTIVTKIGNLVRQYAGRTFKQTDFCGIIHLADTDGAFIPDDDIVESNRVSKTTYSETDIQTNNKSLCEKRNKLKRENMKRLATTPTIWNIPYRIYYMSRNLDHVLYGKPDSSDAEKERNSLDFALIKTIFSPLSILFQNQVFLLCASIHNRGNILLSVFIRWSDTLILAYVLQMQIAFHR